MSRNHSRITIPVALPVLAVLFFLAGTLGAEEDMCNCHYRYPLDKKLPSDPEIRVYEATATVVFKKTGPNRKSFELIANEEVDMGVYALSAVKEVKFSFATVDVDLRHTCDIGLYEPYAHFADKSKMNLHVNDENASNPMKAGEYVGDEKEKGLDWSYTWTPSAGGTQTFFMSCNIDDKKPDDEHKDSDDDPLAYSASEEKYKSKITLVGVEIIQGTDRYAPVGDQGGANELVAKGTPGKGSYKWSVEGIKGDFGDKAAASTYFEGKEVGDGYAKVEYTLGGVTCEDQIDIHTWKVLRVELDDSSSETAAEAGENVGRLTAASETNDSEKDIPHYYIPFDEGEKSLKAIIDGKVAETLAEGALTALDKWAVVAGDSVGLTDEKKDDGKVNIYPVWKNKAGDIVCGTTTTISYEAKDADGEDNEIAEGINPTKNIKVTPIGVLLWPQSEKYWPRNSKIFAAGEHLLKAFQYPKGGTCTWSFDKATFTPNGKKQETTTITAPKNLTAKLPLQVVYTYGTGTCMDSEPLQVTGPRGSLLIWPLKKNNPLTSDAMKDNYTSKKMTYKTKKDWKKITNPKRKASSHRIIDIGDLKSRFQKPFEYEILDQTKKNIFLGDRGGCKIMLYEDTPTATSDRPIIQKMLNDSFKNNPKKTHNSKDNPVEEIASPFEDGNRIPVIKAYLWYDKDGKYKPLKEKETVFEVKHHWRAFVDRAEKETTPKDPIIGDNTLKAWVEDLDEDKGEMLIKWSITFVLKTP